MKVKATPDYKLRRQIKSALPYPSRAKLAKEARAMTHALTFGRKARRGLGDSDPFSESVEDKYISDKHISVSEEMLAGFNVNRETLPYILGAYLMGAFTCYLLLRDRL